MQRLFKYEVWVCGTLVVDVINAHVLMYSYGT